MGKESEDYLDSLLNAVQEEVPHNMVDMADEANLSEDNLEEDVFEQKRPSRKEKIRKHKRDASDAFLAEFEKELMESDTGEYLSDLDLDFAMEDKSAPENFDIEPEVNAESEVYAQPEAQETIESAAPEVNDISFDMPMEEEPAVETTTANEDSIMSGLDAIMNSESDTSIPSDLFGMPDAAEDITASDVPGVSDVMEEAGFAYDDLGLGLNEGESQDAGTEGVAPVGDETSADD
ncbi:MAG: hypothetical protein IKX99_06960, partial [Lachnospiraceae bacterium]|nr:hypothetical protein [Lachnospiraceae bacterium]